SQLARSDLRIVRAGLSGRQGRREASCKDGERGARGSSLEHVGPPSLILSADYNPPAPAFARRAARASARFLSTRFTGKPQPSNDASGVPVTVLTERRSFD